MTEVIVERHSEKPLTNADVQKILADAAGCRDIHRIDRHRSLFSADGRNLVCHLTSPDLESVRIALKSQGAVAEIWACSLQDAPGLTKDELASANVFASWKFEEPVELERLEALDPSGTVCQRFHRVRFLRTFVSSDRRRVICLCQAADAESVRLALRDAEPAVARVWAFGQFVA